MSMM